MPGAFLTLRSYAHSMGRDAGERDRLRALTDHDDGGVGGAAIGTAKTRRDAACGAEFDAVLSRSALADRAHEVDPSMSMDEACPPGHEYF